MAAKKKKKTVPKARRKRGNPKKNERPITPAVLEQIGILWMRQVPQSVIAERFGVDEKTIRYHLDRSIIPQWEHTMRSRLKEDMARVAHIERVAWERFESAEPGETREHVEKALLEGGHKPRIVKQVVSKVTRTGEVAWIQVVQWCLEFRARIYAHFAPVRHHVEMGSELRVAGKTPAEVDREMLQRLKERVEERRRYEESLGAGEN